MFVTVRARSWLSAANPGAQLLLGKSFYRAISSTVERSPTGTEPKGRDYLKSLPSALSYHWDTLLPTKAHFKYADSFFTKQQPTHLWSTHKLQAMSLGESPEVCFLGRSNVGKSSLLNALLGKKMAFTSSKPGRTQSMNAFAVGGEEGSGKNRLVVLDMPGYGKGGRAEWGAEIMKYLEKRKQLKRAFLLVDTVHGIKASDEQLLALFRQQGIPHQIILAKVDRLLFPTARLPSEKALEARLADLRRTMETVKAVVQPDIEDISGALGELIACSSEKRINGKKLGIDSVRHAMLQAVGLEYQPPQKSVMPQEIVPFDEIKWSKDSSTI